MVGRICWCLQDQICLLEFGISPLKFLGTESPSYVFLTARYHLKVRGKDAPFQARNQSLHSDSMNEFLESSCIANRFRVTMNLLFATYLQLKDSEVRLQHLVPPSATRKGKWRSPPFSLIFGKFKKSFQMQLLTATLLVVLIHLLHADLFGTGRKQSVAVAGHLVCDGKPASGVKVKLYDKEMC